MSNADAVRKGMTRIPDGIMDYNRTLGRALLEEFERVALGPWVSLIRISFQSKKHPRSIF